MTQAGFVTLLTACLLAGQSMGNEAPPAMCPDRSGDPPATIVFDPQDGARIAALSDTGDPVLSDGTALHMADILYADRLGALSDTDRAALAEQRQARIAALLEQATLVACRLEAERDRYGRLSGDAGTSSRGAFLRKDLLAEGLAVVLPGADSHACCIELYRQEDQARRAARGLWALSLAPYQEVDRRTGAARIPDRRFAIVEGRIRSIGDRDHVIYLNFGFDWSQDFTVSVTKRLFEPAELDRILTLMGKRVRVRGMADPWKGGRIAVTSLDQIEVLR